MTTPNEPITPPVEVVGESRPQAPVQPAPQRGAVNIPRGSRQVENDPRLLPGTGATFGDAQRQGAQRGTYGAHFSGEMTPEPEKPSLSARARAAFSPALVIALVSCACAAIMVWGNPTLWITDEQEVSAQFADGIDREDQEFLSRVLGDADTGDVTVLGQYQAISQTGGSARAENLATAASLIDGLMVSPGETFSLNEAFGDVSTDTRFLDAPDFTGEVVRTARGGGVCQVASALYIAAVKANLEVVERSPHAMVVDYAPIGLDANVAFGTVDLKLRNNQSTPVYIRATASGQVVSVKIFGWDDGDGLTFEATSRILDRSEVAASEYFSDPQVAGIDPDARVTVYRSESYKVPYKDGVMQESILLSEDSYRVSIDSESRIVAEST